MQDAEGNISTNVYDVAGQMVAMQDARGYCTTYVYDDAGRRTVLFTATGARTTSVYDVAGQMIREIDPLARVCTYAYDQVGNQTLTFTARGDRITMTYDELNRRTGDRFPTGRRNTFSYDAVSNRTGMADTTGVSTMTYSSRNELSSTANPADKRITYTYDPVQGRRRTMANPDSGITTYAYDGKGRLATQINPQNQTTTFGYDVADRKLLVELGNGLTTTYQYDAAGRLTFQRNADSLGVTKSGFTYTYDRVGNRLSVLEDDGDRTTWTYDPTYQLLTENRTGNVAFRATFTYDPVGNRLTQADLDDGLITYSYDPANELLTEISSLGTTSYTYDATGNRASKDDPVVGLTNYAFDETNRMLVADPPGGEVVSLTYNADDQLVVKENNAGARKFVYDVKKLLLETKADDSTELVYDFALTDEYGDLTSRYHDGLTNTDYYVADGLGSTDTMTDDGGADIDTYAYRAFGEIASPPASEPNDFTFVGRQGYFHFPEVQLYFAGMSGGNGAAGRPLDPRTAQWLSKDPDPAADPDNDRVYVENNPVNLTDPKGRAPDGWDSWLDFFGGTAAPAQGSVYSPPAGRVSPPLPYLPSPVSERFRQASQIAAASSGALDPTLSILHGVFVAPVKEKTRQARSLIAGNTDQLARQWTAEQLGGMDALLQSGGLYSYITLFTGDPLQNTANRLDAASATAGYEQTSAAIAVAMLLIPFLGDEAALAEIEAARVSPPDIILETPAAPSPGPPPPRPGTGFPAVETGPTECRPCNDINPATGPANRPPRPAEPFPSPKGTSEGGQSCPCSVISKGTFTADEAAQIEVMKAKSPSSYADGESGFKDSLGYPVRHPNVAQAHLAKQAEVANELITTHSLTSDNGLVLYNKPLKPLTDPFANGNPAIKPDVQVFEKTSCGWRRVGKPVEIEPKGRGFEHKNALYKDNRGGSFEPVEY